MLSSSGNFWLPLGEYSQTFWNWPESDSMWTCELNGEKAWTNGHMILLGDPPIEPNGTQSLDRLKDRFEREVYELHPVAAVRLGHCSVVFDSGHLINARYFNVIREKFPTAQWFGDEASKSLKTSTPSVLALVDGKLIGVVMCLRTDYWSRDVGEILEILEALKHGRKHGT